VHTLPLRGPSDPIEDRGDARPHVAGTVGSLPPGRRECGLLRAAVQQSARGRSALVNNFSSETVDNVRARDPLDRVAGGIPQQFLARPLRWNAPRRILEVSGIAIVGRETRN
jgi:hypothetical protein